MLLFTFWFQLNLEVQVSYFSVLPACPRSSLLTPTRRPTSSHRSPRFLVCRYRHAYIPRLRIHPHVYHYTTIHTPYRPHVDSISTQYPTTCRFQSQFHLRSNSSSNPEFIFQPFQLHQNPTDPSSVSPPPSLTLKDLPHQPNLPRITHTPCALEHPIHVVACSIIFGE